MSKGYQIASNKADIDRMVSTYFNFINGKYLKTALKWFANKEGYGQEIVFVFFQNDFDDYDMAQLPRPLDDKHVLVELGFPAVEIDQIAYLDFKTFYDYLDGNVKKEAERNPEGNEFIELLKKVKSSLEI
ncbi:hypothetical protein QJV03_08205 [Listeria swaminathanii]|uniref:CDI immunity protein domain-containing protein n=1 Tax=Listeria swaminathanii TaxID=2713501 RepID=A0ABU2IHK0_9LIST|nr:hypothetical protein [Listeria swaminathanii]MDT0017161.1 hypothetical protein [Listeria swaminathanii]MDT0023115.1 hypothetical protein [Listeria swaminathanii]MDT0034057.1 hypothetical protein [Listeria swaminathanii]MDT0052880.1 hypothetical protein [Listeria swaminathanii]MDT0055645.1 hypothetical protein [Listeria swaminathanii]